MHHITRKDRTTTRRILREAVAMPDAYPLDFPAGFLADYNNWLDELDAKETELWQVYAPMVPRDV